MAGALVSTILNQLATMTQQEWRFLAGVEQEVNKVESYLKDIHALLEDAEEKQMTERSVKRWLTRVKEVSYDLEDVLDEWNTVFWKTKAVEDGLFQTLKKKVLSLIFCDLFRQVCWRHKIAAQIERINGDLDEIAKEKDRYQFVKREIKQPRRVETTSFVDVSKLHGRDEVKKQIVCALLSEERRQTISLVGMGGIGKTALAQLIYNDDDVQKHFSKLIWVCVSDYFDQYKIARAILDSFPTDSNSSIPISLQGILDKICEKITNTKFFLVLDDVWTERDEDWEPFKAVFRNGMSGSRVLVTTRKDSVAEGMESFRVFHLNELSDHFSWLILSQIAFSGKDKEVCETLEDVGKEIAAKCKGLPLAAKTLGGLLKGKRSKEEWQSVLNSEFWTLNIAQEYIFTPLLLSYYDLPPAIRPCLLYCVIFPKDYVMGKFELITHWMAHGYLNSDDGENVDMEVVGEEYFNYLASRSLFQDFERDDSGSIKYCKMHDIVYDFVKFLVKDEISNKGDDSDLLFGNVRHLSVSIKASTDFFTSAKVSMEKCRSFVLVSEYRDLRVEVLKDKQNIFNKGKCLRLLEINHCGIMLSRILKRTGNLIHLRYLSVFGCNMKRLPEEVCELYNLQYLDVSESYIEKIPDGIGKLINLMYLFTSPCPNIKYYPKGIARLTRLRTLDFVFAEASNHPTRFCFGDLENLDLLREELFVGLVGTTLDMEEVKRAKLHNKINLEQLIISCKSSFLQEEIDRVLEALHPPPNLTIKTRVSY